MGRQSLPAPGTALDRPPDEIEEGPCWSMTFAIPSFDLPNQLYFRRGSMALVRQLTGKRAAIICGAESFEKGGRLVKMEGLLDTARVESRVVGRVRREPDTKTVQELGQAISEFEPDWIIAVGGGSVIDAAKGAWVAYEHPGFDFETGHIQAAAPPLRAKARLVAIPTTGGSGSEVSNRCVLESCGTGAKWSLVSSGLIPDISILDAALSDSLPPALTGGCGFGALSLAIEAYVGTQHNDFTDACALHAARSVISHLPTAVEGAKNFAARDALHHAGTLAGLAHANASAGLTQAFARAFSARYRLRHGIATALFLVAVMEFNMKSAKRYDDLGAALGVESREGLLVTIYRLRARVRLPETLAEAGLDPEVVQRDRDEILARVAADPSFRSNPRRARLEDLGEILDLVNLEEQSGAGETAVILKKRS